MDVVAEAERLQSHSQFKEQTHGHDICCGSENVVVELDSASVLCLEQINNDFQYTPVNVPGPALVGTDPREVQYSGCSCNLPSCDPSTCLCIMRFGPNYTTSGQLLQSNINKGNDDDASDNDAHKRRDGVLRSSKPIFECNASCLCGESCINRVVQNGIRHKMAVFRTQRKGWGIRALEPIEKDAFVCEYAGEVLTHDEIKSRTACVKSGDMNYIFVLKETFGVEESTQTNIDARRKGSIARFINHSCEPNLYLVAVRVHNEIPRVAMFARRDISLGEELSYHYCGDLPKMDLESETNLDKSRKLCMCESASCQKYLPCDPSINCS